MKGGYEVRIARQRAFCPFSQIDTLRNTDPSEHEGRVYQFRIIEYKEGGRNLVVSRRALLEEEQRASAVEVRRSIVAGAVMTGRVASVREFGAFVDLGGGVQGLLHVSEMGWSRVSDTSQVVKPGEEITVKVLRVDEDTQKISLGLKQLTADPWSRSTATYEVGQVRTGRVTRVAEFGAFVELEPGVEGLAHASTFAPTGRSEGWSTVGRAGDDRRIRDPEHRPREEADWRRARSGGLGARPAATAPSPLEIVPGARLTGKVERHEKFGVFVFLAPGRTGLDPVERDRRGQGSGRRESVSRRRRRRGRRPRSRPGGPPHSSQRQGSPGRARGRGSARVHRTRGCGAGGGVRIARRQAPRRTQAAGEVGIDPCHPALLT